MVCVHAVVCDVCMLWCVMCACCGVCVCVKMETLQFCLLCTYTLYNKKNLWGRGGVVLLFF